MALNINTQTDAFATTAMKPEPDEELVSDWGQKIAANTGALANQMSLVWQGNTLGLTEAGEGTNTATFLYIRMAAHTRTSWEFLYNYSNDTLARGTARITLLVDGTWMGSLNPPVLPLGSTVVNKVENILVGMGGFSQGAAYIGQAALTISGGNGNSAVTLLQVHQWNT